MTVEQSLADICPCLSNLFELHSFNRYPSTLEPVSHEKDREETSWQAWKFQINRSIKDKLNQRSTHFHISIAFPPFGSFWILLAPRCIQILRFCQPPRNGRHRPWRVPCQSLMHHLLQGPEGFTSIWSLYDLSAFEKSCWLGYPQLALGKIAAYMLQLSKFASRIHLNS